MKSNKTPEKLYIALDELTEDRRTFVLDHRVDYPICTEYTRTDAFIDKACEYFRKGLEDVKVMDDYRNIAVRGIQASYTSVEEFIEDFKKYMEGE